MQPGEDLKMDESNFSLFTRALIVYMCGWGFDCMEQFVPHSTVALAWRFEDGHSLKHELNCVN